MVALWLILAPGKGSKVIGKVYVVRISRWGIECKLVGIEGVDTLDRKSVV